MMIILRTNWKQKKKKKNDCVVRKKIEALAHLTLSSILI